MNVYRNLLILTLVLIFLKLSSFYIYGSDGFFTFTKVIRLLDTQNNNSIIIKVEEEEILSEVVTPKSQESPIPEAVVIDLKDRFVKRKNHLEEMCSKHNLDTNSKTNRRRTEQFLIDQKHGLIWCNIFKAASSSWLWNFNLLAGYSEETLIKNIQNPLGMARKKYIRPSANQLDVAQSEEIPHPITFIIVRHPFTRLISGFRDKILEGKEYYRNIATEMMTNHPELQEQHPDDWHENLPVKTMVMPTFAQFVQYIIDLRQSGKTLNEHWIAMNDYCTPCLNHFNVIAKVETLVEDGNYIIKESGIQDIVKPNVLNKASGITSEDLNDYFICQLNEQQLIGLIEIYKYDLELFDYDVQKYIDCVVNKK